MTLLFESLTRRIPTAPNQLLLLLLIFITGFSGAISGAYAQDPNRYLLSPGDTLQISVWKDDALNREVLILPDGKISFPLVGFIDTTGKSASELQEVLTTNLKKFVSDPVVTIAVNNVNGNRIYIIGKVARPGEYPVARPVDVLQALSLAGGLNPFANEDNILVIRRTKEKSEKIGFEYSEVSKGRNLESNILLKSGDIVVVP